MSGRICKGCGAVIEGDYLTALGVDWHPEHFVCAVCGRPLRGGFLVDAAGTPYCTDRETDHPRCRFCGHLVTGRARGGDAGGARCQTCASRAVNSARDAQTRFATVVRWAVEQGLTFPRPVRIHVELADAGQLTRDKDDDDDRAPLGKAYTRTFTQNGRLVSSEVDRILIERGLPTPLFEGVAMHELGHVWLAIQLVCGLPKWTEEGFCEMIAHRWHASRGRPKADIRPSRSSATQALFTARAFASSTNWRGPAGSAS